jgi:hypothetical protein
MIVDTKKEGNFLHKKVIYMISPVKSTPLLYLSSASFRFLLLFQGLPGGGRRGIKKGVSVTC